MYASVQAIRDYDVTLSRDERTALKMDDFDYQGYQKQFLNEEAANKHAGELLESLAADRALYKRELALDKAGVTIPSILRRFEQLAPRWRVYAYIRITEETVDMEDVLKEDDGTEKLVNTFFEMMSDVELDMMKQRRKKGGRDAECIEFLENTHAVLLAAEGK